MGRFGSLSPDRLRRMAFATLASAASLGGTWLAWISDTTSSPSVRFARSTAGYVLLDGTPVAVSWTALASSGPTHAIDLTETGASLAAASANDSKTWTGTLVDGALGAPSCSDFASNAATVAVAGRQLRGISTSKV